MPFKSKAQMKKFYAMERRGEIPKGTADEWARKTKSVSSLPERVGSPNSKKKRRKKKSDLLKRILS